MISRAQDYELTVPAGRIDGGILPARDVRADGSARTLRAEDLSFAVEAAAERSLAGAPVASPYTSWLPAPSLVLRTADRDLVWRRLRENHFRPGASAENMSWPRAVSRAEAFADTAFAELGEETGGRPKLGLADHFPGAYEESCHGAVAGGGRVLDETYMWRGFYYDLLRADRLRIGQSYSGQCTYVDRDGTAKTVQVSGATKEPTGTERNLQELVYVQDGPQSGPPWQARAVQSGISSASLSTPVPLPELAASAKLVALYQLHIVGNPPDFNVSTGHDYCFARAYDATVSDGAAHVPQGFLLPESSFDLLSVCAGLGHALPASYESSIAWDRLLVAYVYCLRTYLIVDYNFRTSIRSIGWTWTP